MPQPHELSGGGGFTFEDAPVAIYLGALLGEESGPGLNDRIVVRVAVQQAAYGEPLDDLIVDGRSDDDTVSRLSLQTKRELTISAATTNTDFREIVTRAWATLQKPTFREDIDRVGAVVGTISEASRRAFVTICDWARASESVETFVAHFQPGLCDDDKRNALKAVCEILGDDGGTTGDAKAWRLLRHFVLIRFDVLHEGSTHDAHAIERLRNHLHEPSRAGDLWQRLLRLARDAAGKAQEFSRLSLLSYLRGAVRLAGVRSRHADLERVMEETQNALDSIACDIGGIEIPRPALVETVRQALERSRFITIVGLPGAGKSAVLHACVQDEMRNGTVLLLKSDRLTGPNWAAHARSLGIMAPTIESLLSEISATGSSVLYIDGIDRIVVNNRGVVVDLLNAIHRSALLSHWKIVATCRDNGIEPLRTWLPATIFGGGGGVATVEVGSFNDAEAEELALAKPALRPLLFGDDRVKEIARRPFFAAVLARSLETAAGERAAPQSEVELLNVWWARGGYDSDEQRIYQRQRTLIQLAKAGAVDLGRHIRLEGLDVGAVADLRRDNIIKDVIPGHTVQFAHDIFFEWTFLHLLIDRDMAWLDEIRAVGEPPALGRVVELFSQATLAQQSGWEQKLIAVENSGMRPQWTRNWLIAPFGAPTYWNRATDFAQAILHNKAQRLSKLAVWFQAEKTRANPLVLDRTFGSVQLARREIIRLADLLAWPSEPASWSRFCSWSVANIGEFPIPTIPDLLAAFEVWQNMFVDYPNPVSKKIFDTALGWLEDIEARQHPQEFSYNPGPWRELERGGVEELEQRLRALVLRAARVEPDKIRNYLVRAHDRDRLRRHAFSQIIDYAPTLVENHSHQLVEIIKLELLDDLPEVERGPDSRRRTFAPRVSYHDWDRLSIREDHTTFYPPSPLREPFASLFRVKPDEARALVRDIANHAITAWRQLYKLDPEHHATPIPLVFNFPWGAQEFWGDGRAYVWARGHWAPSPVIAGLMALEEWAFSQSEGGRDVDEVIHDVLEGHQSSSALGIATALALGTNRVSETTLPLATSQKIWEWDIARYVQEGGEAGMASNLIGFMKPADIQHQLAVRRLNERPARHMEIRWLAQLFVISAHEDLRKGARDAITSFPDALPFDVEEEKTVAEHVARKRRTAEIWAEWGKLENYRATAAPDGTGTYIQLENPQQTAPDVVAVTESSARLNERLGLLHWAKQTLEGRSVDARFAVQEAINHARGIDRADLFTEPHGQINDEDYDRSAVAGVAAAVLMHGGKIDQTSLRWCKDVTFRAAATPQFIDQTFHPSAKHLFHPCDFALRGLEGLIRRQEDVAAAKEAILRLAGYALEEISERAFSIALSMWARDPDFAWAALRLGARLSLESHRERNVYVYDVEHEAEKSRKVVAAAIEEFNHGGPPAPLPDVPPAWIKAPPRGSRGEYDNDEDAIWREPDDYLRWDFLPKVLKYVPIPDAMRDAQRALLLLKYTYSLLNWTIEKIQPPWEEEDRHENRRVAEIGQWRQGFSYFLAKVALELDEDTVRANILDLVFALNDEAADSIINPFADILSAGGIIDPPRVMPNAVGLMRACVDRVLRNRAWESASYDDGDIYGYDLPEIVRIFLFATGVRADQSSRFANGDWRDVGAILPIVDPFVRAVGNVPHVMGSFLTLCEAAVEHYLPNIFIDQISEVLRKHPGVPVGWHGTTIASRIAALVHAFAERLQPLPGPLAQDMLRVLDRLVDMGDRRSAALQTSEIFRNVRQAA